MATLVLTAAATAQSGCAPCAWTGPKVASRARCARAHASVIGTALGLLKKSDLGKLVMHLARNDDGALCAVGCCRRDRAAVPSIRKAADYLVEMWSRAAFTINDDWRTCRRPARPPPPPLTFPHLQRQARWPVKSRSWARAPHNRWTGSPPRLRSIPFPTHAPAQEEG